MPLRSFTVPDWLGLNSETAPEVLPPGALVVAENWDLDKPSRAERRLGSTAWGPVISGGIRRVGFLRGTDGDPDYLIALSTDAAYHQDVRNSWPSTSWTRIDASTGRSFVAQGEESVFQDNLFIANAQNPVLVQDDLNFRNAYLRPPTVALRASLSAGSLTGAYAYKCTHRAYRRTLRNQAVIESNSSPCTATVTTATQQVTLTGFQASEDAAATATYIYRAKGSTGNVYYYVGEVAPSATSYVDNLADASVGEEMHDDTHAPPDELISAPHHICAHRNRLFLAADNFDIIFSEVEVPYYWGPSTASGYTTNMLTLSAEQTEGYITGLFSQWDVLLALTRGGIWEVAGDDMSNYSVRKIENVGCIAPQSVAQSPVGLFFLSNRGVELYDGQQVIEVSTPVRTELRSLLNTSARGVWYNDRYLIRMSDTKMYAYWPDGQRWSTYTMGSSRWEQNQLLVMARSEQEALFGVSRLNTGQMVNCLAAAVHTDDGTIYTPNLKSGYMDFQIPYRYKSVNRVQTEAETTSDGGGLYVVAIPGSQGSPVTASWGPTSDGRQYGYGIVSGCVGSDFQLQITHTGSAPIEVRRVNMEYTLREASLR